jgi:hypothetical protein
MARTIHGDQARGRHGLAEDTEATDLGRWLSKDQIDVRVDIPVTEEVLAFITEAKAK